MGPGWHDRQGLAPQARGGPARAHALIAYATLTRPRSCDAARLCEQCVLLLEARHRTERHLQPAFLLGRGLGSQNHGHQRECLHERCQGERC
jgi:hypothetical protein